MSWLYKIGSFIGTVLLILTGVWFLRRRWMQKGAEREQKQAAEETERMIQHSQDVSDDIKQAVKNTPDHELRKEMSKSRYSR